MEGGRSLSSAASTRCCYCCPVPVSCLLTLQSHGLPGKVHISSGAYERIMHKQEFEITERGNINVKGKGIMR